MIDIEEFKKYTDVSFSTSKQHNAQKDFNKEGHQGQHLMGEKLPLFAIMKTVKSYLIGWKKVHHLLIETKLYLLALVRLGMQK